MLKQIKPVFQRRDMMHSRTGSRSSSHSELSNKERARRSYSTNPSGSLRFNRTNARTSNADDSGFTGSLEAPLAKGKEKSASMKRETPIGFQSKIIDYKTPNLSEIKDA